jgi:flagellar export protein FliJ
MKKFQFRYQTLLEVRERRKKTEEERLQALTAEVQARESELAALKAEENASREGWLTMQREGALDLQQMVMYQEFFQRMEIRQRHQGDRIEEARARVLNQRDILMLAHQEHEAIAKLKERDYKAWQTAIDRAEAAFIDELATVRYVRPAHGDPTIEGPA